jgi:hypothetical protein
MELQYAEVKVSAREVHVDERPEEVIVVIPRATKDVQLVHHAGTDKVLEKEWARRGGRCSTERDEGGRRPML